MSYSFEEYAKKLQEKVANIPPCEKHIMKKRGNLPLSEELDGLLDELEAFSKFDLAEFENYEKWLEGKGGTNQKR